MTGAGAFALGVILTLVTALLVAVRALAIARRDLGRAEARLKSLEAENASIAQQRDRALAGPDDLDDLSRRLRDAAGRV